MSDPPELSRRQLFIFERLLFGHNFQAGTKEQIARYLNGNYATGLTRRFVDQLIELGCLVYVENRMVRVGERMAERPVFDRDRKRMKALWLNTSEALLTVRVMKEDELILL